MRAYPITTELLDAISAAVQAQDPWIKGAIAFTPLDAEPGTPPVLGIVHNLDDDGALPFAVAEVLHTVHDGELVDVRRDLIEWEGTALQARDTVTYWQCVPIEDGPAGGQ